MPSCSLRWDSFFSSLIAISGALFISPVCLSTSKESALVAKSNPCESKPDFFLREFSTATKASRAADSNSDLYRSYMASDNAAWMLYTSKNPLSFFREYGIRLPQQGQNVKSQKSNPYVPLLYSLSCFLLGGREHLLGQV